MAYKAFLFFFQSYWFSIFYLKPSQSTYTNASHYMAWNFASVCKIESDLWHSVVSEKVEIQKYFWYLISENTLSNSHTLVWCITGTRWFLPHSKNFGSTSHLSLIVLLLLNLKLLLCIWQKLIGASSRFSKRATLLLHSPVISFCIKLKSPSSVVDVPCFRSSVGYRLLWLIKSTTWEMSKDSRNHRRPCSSWSASMTDSTQSQNSSSSNIHERKAAIDMEALTYYPGEPYHRSPQPKRVRMEGASPDEDGFDTHNDFSKGVLSQIEADWIRKNVSPFPSYSRKHIRKRKHQRLTKWPRLEKIFFACYIVQESDQPRY